LVVLEGATPKHGQAWGRGASDHRCGEKKRFRTRRIIGKGGKFPLSLDQAAFRTGGGRGKGLVGQRMDRANSAGVRKGKKKK